MKHKIYLISDIEMGRGDIMDDFSDDNLLVDFVERITPRDEDEKTTLVLLGDIFDFLKMSYKGAYPRYVTEEISLWKLDEVIDNHKEIFKAFKQFLENKNCEIHFIIGNHDADLAWPKVQGRIRETLRSHEQVKFEYEFQTKHVHAEHGHNLDPFFATNIKKPIINFKNKEILNLPWGSQACFSHLVHLKKKFPREESYYPNPAALEKNDDYRKQSNKASRDLILKSLIINPLLHPFDPTYRAPYLKFIKHGLRFGLNVVDDEKFVDHRANSMIKQHPDKKVLVMGHAHVLSDLNIKGRKVFVTDTWRDEYDLMNDEQKKPKSYVEISYDNARLTGAELKEID